MYAKQHVKIETLTPDIVVKPWYDDTETFFSSFNPQPAIFLKWTNLAFNLAVPFITNLCKSIYTYT